MAENPDGLWLLPSKFFIKAVGEKVRREEKGFQPGYLPCSGTFKGPQMYA